MLPLRGARVQTLIGARLSFIHFAAAVLTGQRHLLWHLPAADSGDNPNSVSQTAKQVIRSAAGPLTEAVQTAAK
jgi:hypothetical protein